VEKPPAGTSCHGLKLPVLAARISIAFTAVTALLFSQPQGTKTPAFEVASVKLVPPPQNHPQGFRTPSSDIRGVSGNRFTESYITVTELIMQAYDVKSYQIFGLPSWGDWMGDQFEIVARTEGSGRPPVSQVRLMLRTLLAERFRLKVHRAVKELPVYELVIDRNGPKLTTVSSVTPPGAAKTSSAPKWRTSMESLVQLISVHLDRPVIDRTGLTGKLNEFQLDQIALANCKPRDDAFDCVFPLVQEQLGLKLNRRRDTIEGLMVERVERPTGN
jgi:uncharacterized protein (TIGR03435 family)